MCHQTLEHKKNTKGLNVFLTLEGTTPMIGSSRVDDQSRPEPLSEWLNRMNIDRSRGEPGAMVTYMESLMRLFVAIIHGRNEMTTAVIRSWIPPDLLYYLMKTPAIIGTRKDPGFVRFTRRVADLALALYIDNTPHEVMARFKGARIWRDVPSIAQSECLSTRLSTALEQKIDWNSFEPLKELAVEYLSQYHWQSGTEVDSNHMVLVMLKIVYSLTLHGFWPPHEMTDKRYMSRDPADGEVNLFASQRGENRVSLIQVLLNLLDGRQDVQGLFSVAQGHPQVSWGKGGRVGLRSKWSSLV